MSRAEETITLSSDCFMNIVWPVIKDSLGGGEVCPVEGNSFNDMQGILDRVSGIDAWHVMKNQDGVRGIASRVQPDDKRSGWPYNTFTIRYSLLSGNDTEYQKRLKAVTNPERGYLFPAITTQAYVESYDGPLVSVGIIHTVNLYKAAELHSDVWSIVPGKDGNKFMALHWDKLRDLGYSIRTIDISRKGSL